MKSFELYPTPENIEQTYLMDTLHRNSFLYKFIELLFKIDDRFSICIDGKWGSGKTFFIKQSQIVINSIYSETETNIKTKWEKDTQNSNIANSSKYIRTVYYDAWENDNDDDPALSLIYTIINDLQTTNTLTYYDKKEIAKYLIKLVSSFTSYKEITDKLLNTAKIFKKKDLLSEIKEQKNLHQHINDFFKSIMQSKNEKIVIFIDELDRCNPQYAIKLLERIKHYFNNSNIIFVFTTNINQLQYTIKQFYGNDFDASTYLERFFDLQLYLPEVEKNLFLQFLNFNNYTTTNVICKDVISYFNFSLREIEKYIKTINIALGQFNEIAFDDGSPHHRAILFCNEVIIPILIGAKLHDINIFNEAISGHNPKIIINIISNINNAEDLCKCLLKTHKETFNSSPSSNSNSYIQSVEISDKLEEVYNVLFSSSISGEYFIGNCCFTKQTRDHLFQTISLLSPFSNFDIENI